MPRRHGLLGEPERQASAPYQRSVVFRPVRYPVSGFGDFVAAALVELVRHGSAHIVGRPMLRCDYQPRHRRPYRGDLGWLDYNLRYIHAPTRENGDAVGVRRSPSRFLSPAWIARRVNSTRVDQGRHRTHGPRCWLGCHERPARTRQQLQ